MILLGSHAAFAKTKNMQPIMFKFGIWVALRGVVRHYFKVGHHVKIQNGCVTFCQNNACAQ
jgi:hypothetical protein